jgi:cytochrome c peroxidase
MNHLFDNPIRLACISALLFAATSALADRHIDLPKPARDSDFRQHSAEEVKLGQMLFFDKILSGNRNISCATCHSPVIATVDGLSVNIGTGGQGLGVLRDAGHYPPTMRDPQSRGIRNMTPLFNLGHKQFTRLFWDGRVQVDETMPQGFLTPAGENLPYGFASPLAALSVFAETDRQEMLGQPGTNEAADASLVSPYTAVWAALVERLRSIPEYVDLFTRAYPLIDYQPENITIVDVGNAIGAFQDVAFRTDNSPFDRYLRGERGTMSSSAKKGMKLFYGRAQCSLCHSGVFQTDHDFHAIGVPQVGPGFGDGATGLEDFGREGVTHDSNDRYRFRTPSLRNVALTGPWGHDGFFGSLEAMIRHHLNPLESLRNADPSQLVLPSRPDLDASDLVVFYDSNITAAIENAIELEPVVGRQSLSDADIRELIDFLQALTDPAAQDLRHTVPQRVPSDLPLAEIR